MAPPPATPLSNIVRLVPLQVGDLPPHPELPQDSSLSSGRPDLVTLVVALLDDGAAFLAPQNFSTLFKHSSTKSTPSSASPVEVWTHSIPSSSINAIEWSTGPVSRSRPRAVATEHWFARRSYHENVSSKDKERPSHASWDEFVFGLRDDHSKHEYDFTPALYDARKVVDWNGEIAKLEKEGHLVGKEGKYSNCTVSIYEMCHAIPPPLNPRCFSVLVVTANVDERSFIVVTVPVDLGNNVGAAFYSNGRNVKEGVDVQQRKQVVSGIYSAVETVKIDEKGKIEWVMATASDAKGILPIWAQKMSIPGVITKDVGYFLKWIRTVDDKDIQR